MEKPKNMSRTDILREVIEVKGIVEVAYNKAIDVFQKNRLNSVIVRLERIRRRI